MPIKLQHSIMNINKREKFALLSRELRLYEENEMAENIQGK